MGDRVLDYKDLKVWQLAMKIAKEVYQITKDFPKEQAYIIVPQLQRAAVSIASNIAEGNSRNGTKDYIRFVNIAQGSAAELETQIILSQELGFTSKNNVRNILDDIIVVRKMLAKLRASLKIKLKTIPQHLTPITKRGMK